MPSQSFYRDKNCADILAFTLNDAIQRKLEVAPLPGSVRGGIVAAHSEILAMRMARAHVSLPRLLCHPGCYPALSSTFSLPGQC
jgi:hypothetical protein